MLPDVSTVNLLHLHNWYCVAENSGAMFFVDFQNVECKNEYRHIADITKVT
jgi:hypothetical protein